ncbi:hypothetical protein [Thermoflavifilum aggregans]|nr:hypothetical protein [Thermoflavifilum aggregans]
MKLFVFMGFISILFGCSKTQRQVPNANLMPAPFDFVLLDSVNNSPLIVSQTQSIKLWYILNGQVNYIEDLRIKPSINSAQYSYYATTVFAPLNSSENVSKTFYCQIDNGKIDTIFLDVKRLAEPVNREYNVYNRVEFNGKIVSLDLNNQPAFWVLKR